MLNRSPVRNLGFENNDGLKNAIRHLIDQHSLSLAGPSKMKHGEVSGVGPHNF